MEKEKKDNRFLIFSVALAATAVFVSLVYRVGLDRKNEEILSEESGTKPTIVEDLTKSDSILSPADLKNLEIRMIDAGVIDSQKFREDLRTELNILWAFGLSNKNRILEEGPMMDFRHGEAKNYASIGGWTLSAESPMDHYSKHAFVVLTEDEQALVERVSKNIYRPCCNNPAYFPDCNHGMAMLGLLEVLASEGASEEKMYEVALKANLIWFPDAYATIHNYLDARGLSFSAADPKEILSANYSSGSGYRRILSEVTLPTNKSGGSCGV